MNGYDEDKIFQLSDSALKLLEGLSPIAGGGGDERGVAVKLQGSGIGLWNKAVALKSAGAISPHLNAQSKCWVVRWSNIRTRVIHITKQ